MKTTTGMLVVAMEQDLDRVAHLWQQLGHTPNSISAYRCTTIRILKKAHTSDYCQITAERVMRMACAYARQKHADRKSVIRNWLAAFRAFSWGLQQFGKTTGSTILPKRQHHKLDPTIAAFLSYGRSRGLSDQSLHIFERHLIDLQHFLTHRRALWPLPRLQDLDLFLKLKAKCWKRTTVSGAASTIRSWLRFLFVTGQSRYNLASSVMLPPSISYPRPARAWPWSMVKQLRRGIDRTTPLGKRDMAQYLLFCSYGLSNAEVINLRLEDLSWESNILHIRRMKNGSTVDLPLSPSVAKAIAKYLQQGRPKTSSRYVFVRHSIPLGPLSHSTVGQRIKCWAERAGVKAPFLGAHVFRYVSSLIMF